MLEIINGSAIVSRQLCSSLVNYIKYIWTPRAHYWERCLLRCSPIPRFVPSAKQKVDTRRHLQLSSGKSRKYRRLIYMEIAGVYFLHQEQCVLQLIADLWLHAGSFITHDGDFKGALRDFIQDGYLLLVKNIGAFLIYNAREQCVI